MWVGKPLPRLTNIPVPGPTQAVELHAGQLPTGAAQACAKAVCDVLATASHHGTRCALTRETGACCSRHFLRRWGVIFFYITFDLFP